MLFNLIHGDCLDKMKDIPDGSVDLILTDPPYGTTACKWDNVIQFEPMWEHVWRVLKPNGTCALFGGPPFGALLINSQIKRFRYDWIWQKTRPANFSQAKRQPLKDHEAINIFYRKQCNYFPIKQERLGSGKERSKYSVKGTGSDPIYGIRRMSYELTNLRYPSSIQKFTNSDGCKRYHPTQKPVALLEYLITTYTLENEIVLDFAMGSGSTGVACKNINRKFIGIEIEKKYFDIAKKRITRFG